MTVRQFLKILNGIPKEELSNKIKVSIGKRKWNDVDYLYFHRNFVSIGHS